MPSAVELIQADVTTIKVITPGPQGPGGTGPQGDRGDPGPAGGGASPPSQYQLNGATSIGAQTITLDRAPDAIVTGKTGVLVIDAYTTNAETRPVASVSGAVVTLTNCKLVSHNAVTFTAASKKIAYTGVTQELRPGMKVVITGSASNNGTFTVVSASENGATPESIVVSETVVNESPGATVSLRASLNSAHANGALVQWFPAGLIPGEALGLKATGLDADAATNTTQLQRACVDFYYFQTSFAGIKLPAGRMSINARILVTQSMVIEGDNVDESIIQAASTFSFPDQNTAMMVSMNLGHVAGVTYTSGNTLSRLHLRNFELDGKNVAGANGIIAALQQPGQWVNFRVINCPGYGMALTGQQYVFTNTEITNCGIGILIYGTAGLQFGWFRGLNIEQCSVACLTGGGDNLRLSDVHVESLPANSIAFNFTIGAPVVIENMWASIPSSPDTGTLLSFNSTSAISTYPVFSIRNLRVSQNSATYSAINDVGRGITRTAAQLNRVILYIESGVYNGPSNGLVPSGWQLESTGAGSGSAGTGVGQGYDRPPFFANGINLARNGTDLSGNIFGGYGAPSSGIGKSGDFYFRFDGGAGTRIYAKSGSSWTGIV